jgi:hypothetical protein
MAEAENSNQTTVGKPFKPGQSGNPGGRPAVAKEFRARCRDFMQAHGWRQLEAIACDRKDRDKYRALELIAAYAYGKPKQGIELTGADGGPVELATLTPEERAARIGELLAKRGG